MVLCKHCMNYLDSMGYRLYISGYPLYDSVEDEEIKDEVCCEWCEDTLEMCGELFETDFIDYETDSIGRV